MSTVPSWLEDPSAPSESDGRLTDARPSDSPLAGPRPSLAAGAPHPLRVGVVSIFVFCLLASGAIGSFVIFKQKVSTDERRLLDERAAQNASLFEAFTVQIEDALDRGTIVTAASEVDQAAFQQAFNESLDESLLTTAAVFEIDELGQRTEVLSTGAEASVLKVITEAGRERMHRASAQGGVQLVDIATVGGAKIVGLAAAPAGGSSRIAYAELLVPEVIGDAGSTQGEDIEFAFYLADRETSDALVASNARVLPIAPPRVVNRMQLGSEEPLFIVRARDSLVGPVTALSPWIALTIGFIAAVILSSFVETTRRGRDEALHLVDDLRITNADLDRSEKRFRGLFDSANDVVFTAKADGTILSMNQAGELFTGYGHNELLGKDFAELLASSDAKPAQDEFSELISSLADGGAREIELVTRDGERAARRDARPDGGRPGNWS